MKIPDIIPYEYVTRSLSFDPKKSSFTTFLETVLDPMVVEGLVDQYQLGVTKAGDVIFFQIDQLGRCRTGKVMKYNRETGHRIKDENMPGRITWVHSLMKQSGQLPKNWELTQCLFGEHLLLLHVVVILAGKISYRCENHNVVVQVHGLFFQRVHLCDGLRGIPD